MLAQNTVPTGRRASAFNRIRQRTARRKNDRQVVAAAAAIYSPRAAAIVCQTRSQSTPRSASYRRIAETRMERSQDQNVRLAAVTCRLPLFRLAADRVR